MFTPFRMKHKKRAVVNWACEKSVLATEDIRSKKGLINGPTHPFSSPSSDQTHDDKVSCMQDSCIQFPTFLSITEAQRESKTRLFDVSNMFSTKYPPIVLQL